MSSLRGVMPTTGGGTARTAKSPLVLAFVLFMTANFASLLLEVPYFRIFEKSICNRYFRTIDGSGLSASADVDESQCKTASVQDLLGQVVGWKISFDAIPGLLTAIYYGSLAETRGRRVVLLLSLLGTLLMLAWVLVICSLDDVFPTQVSWLGSAFLFVGGGPRVFNAVIYALVSDLLDHTDRTKHLYLLAGSHHVNKLISPRIAAALMGVNTLAPFLVSMLLLAGCLALSTFVTETRHQEDQYEALAHDETDQLPSTQPHFVATSTTPPHKAQPSGDSASLSLQARLQETFGTVKFLFSTPVAQFCLAAFFLKRVAFTSENFVSQYGSEKFDWELRQTTWLRVAAASGAVFMTIVLWPNVTKRLIKRGHDPHVLDLNVVRGSFIILIISFFLAWLARSKVALILAMLLAGFGEGLEPALQGIVTYITDSTHNSQLFTTVAVCDTLAELTGGPLTAKLMSIGRKPDHPSDGYCFFASALMFSVLEIWSWFVSTGS